jgi:hypothetical protein
MESKSWFLLEDHGRLDSNCHETGRRAMLRRSASAQKSAHLRRDTVIRSELRCKYQLIKNDSGNK